MGRLKLNKKAKKFLKKHNVSGPIDQPGEVIANKGRMMNYYRSFEKPFEVSSSHSEEGEQTWYCCGDYHNFPVSMSKDEIYARLLHICSVKEAPKNAIFVQSGSEKSYVAD